MQLQDILYEVSEGIATLTLNRPDARNAYSEEMIDSIVHVLDVAEEDDSVRCLIITGAGGAFSAGGDIKLMLDHEGMFEGDPVRLRSRYKRGIQRIPRRLARFEKPVIAAINGPAVGAGLDLACMCDIRLGSQAASVGETFVNLGIISADGGSWFLPRVVGMQRAAEMTFSGRLVDAAEALSIGLFLEVVEPENLLRRAVAMASQFAGKPRAALRMSKRLLQHGQRASLNDFLDFAASQQSLCHTSQQHHDALAALFAGQPALKPTTP